MRKALKKRPSFSYERIGCTFISVKRRARIRAALHSTNWAWSQLILTKIAETPTSFPFTPRSFLFARDFFSAVERLVLVLSSARSAVLSNAVCRSFVLLKNLHGKGKIFGPKEIVIIRVINDSGQDTNAIQKIYHFVINIDRRETCCSCASFNIYLEGNNVNGIAKCFLLEKRNYFLLSFIKIEKILQLKKRKKSDLREQPRKFSIDSKLCVNFLNQNIMC